MGSYPMRDGVHDFDADKYNDKRPGPSGGPSGKKAGVESGLSSVENVPYGNIEAEQKTYGNVFRQERDEVGAGAKNGKNFKFK